MPFSMSSKIPLCLFPPRDTCTRHVLPLPCCANQNAGLPKGPLKSSGHGPTACLHSSNCSSHGSRSSIAFEMSFLQIRYLRRWLLSVKGLRLRLCNGAYSILREVAFGSKRWLCSWLRLHSKFNERKILKGETLVVYRTPIIY